MCGHDEEGASALGSSHQNRGPFPWHIGVFDVHNHIAERPLSVASLSNMKTRGVSIMATRTQDQSIVSEITASHRLESPECLSRKSIAVVAGYGRHPWFSHELYDDNNPEPTYVKSNDIELAKQNHYKAVLTPSPEDPAFLADLPTPIPLSSFIAETRLRLQADPLAIVGEIGLDKIFRLPMQWEPEAKAVRDPARTPGGRERRPLSLHKIQMSHQKAILLAHLKLAGELGRAVNLHGVQVNGVLYDLLASNWKGHEIKSQRSRQKRQKGPPVDTAGDNRQKPFPPRICLHSFNGGSDAVKQYLRPSIPAKIFFSFSKCHNLSTEVARNKTEDAIKTIPDNRVLVESDLHSAGEIMDRDLEDMYRIVCDVKGWDLEIGVQKIASNYHEFIFG
ncbi:Metallo-dependent hydrolase [Thozetella sp. PMI_491]|nr:Metallo-dependent hydrolase [Thozetella sp. PMI_491]